MTEYQSTPRGLSLASASALFLGLAPIFGKQAILAGMSPLAVVAVRTAGAAGLLAVFLLVFRRRLLTIYPLGLVGCMLAGLLNGIGSILYYSALARLDASLGQLLYSLYPVFVACLLYLDGQRYTGRTLFRLALSLPAVVLLLWTPAGALDRVGVAMMLGASLLYAVHIPVNQRVLYEAPAPTVTLYTLLAMTLTVTVAWGVLTPAVIPTSNAALVPVLALTAVTFLSRASLFAGVKHIGGLENSLIGLGELLVTLVVAGWWLGESLTALQWAGAALLAGVLLLALRDRRPRSPHARVGRGWLHWLLPPTAAGFTAAALMELPGDPALDDQDQDSSPPANG
jgi:drug/metabolite transporter (DMT)-like permease